MLATSSIELRSRHFSSWKKKQIEKSKSRAAFSYSNSSRLNSFSTNKKNGMVPSRFDISFRNDFFQRRNKNRSNKIRRSNSESKTNKKIIDSSRKTKSKRKATLIRKSSKVTRWFEAKTWKSSPNRFDNSRKSEKRRSTKKIDKNFHFELFAKTMNEPRRTKLTEWRTAKSVRSSTTTNN